MLFNLDYFRRSKTVNQSSSEYICEVIHAKSLPPKKGVCCVNTKEEGLGGIFKKKGGEK